MRVILVFCVVVAVAAAASLPAKQLLLSKPMARESPIEELPSDLFNSVFYTNQDHSRPQNTIRVPFAYQANLQHYDNNGIFYIYIKNVLDTSTRWIQEGLMVDIAASTGAALFTFDQRFLGTNNVTESLTFEDLQLLTVEQTLSDIATFISNIEAVHNQRRRARVILWGSGYGATLATWARKRYPHLIDAVWSSSGIFEIETFTYRPIDALEYNILSQGSEQCRNLVLNAFETLQDLIEAGDGENIQSRLNLCSPVDVNSENDIGTLYQAHIQAIFDFIAANHVQGIRNFCSDLEVPAIDALSAFARWKLYVFGQNIECFDHSYESLVERSAVTEFGQPGTLSGLRQFYYLQCTQLGLFSITDELSWLPNKVGYFYHFQKCTDIFGEDYYYRLMEAIASLENEFGSLAQRVTNVFYTNGVIDPWFFNGIILTNEVNSTVTNIEYHSTSADLTSLTPADPIVLVNVKNAIQEQVILWSTLDHTNN